MDEPFDYIVLYYDNSGEIFRTEQVMEDQLEIVLLDFEENKSTLGEPVSKIEIYNYFDTHTAASVGAED